MEISLTKSFLRKSFLQYRKLLDVGIYTSRNEKLLENLIAFVVQKNIQQMHVFLPIERNREPNISLGFQLLWQKNVQIIVSHTDFSKQAMDHFILEEATRLVTNDRGIPEPIGAVETQLDNLDVIFVPLLASDLHGNRIGYGGGYYDRLLAETKALKVGLSLSPPVDRIIQTEKWDVPLDYLITPFKTYKYG